MDGDQLKRKQDKGVVDNRTEIWDNLRQRKAKRMSPQAVIYQDESGAYCAEVPAFPGCHSCGDTYEEAVANIREAAQLWLDCVTEGKFFKIDPLR